jgi:hypothetical protein
MHRAAWPCSINLYSVAKKIEQDLAENFFVGAYSRRQVRGKLNLEANGSFDRLHLSNIDYTIQKGLKIETSGTAFEFAEQKWKDQNCPYENLPDACTKIFCCLDGKHCFYLLDNPPSRPS